jgi:transglutaminase-like putative cysteine protease
MDKYLKPTRFMDFDHPEVSAFTEKTIRGVSDPVEKAVKLFYAVRNGIRYNPYDIQLTEEGMRASTTLSKGASWCVGKAVLLSAACRAAGIPARLGFADVRNHQTPQAIKQVLQTDVFYWHGYSLLYLNEKWVKATPAFDLKLSDRHGVIPVEFDGLQDANFHYYDRYGKPHMEYLLDRGTYDDLPLQKIYDTFLKEYKEEVLQILMLENHPVKKKIREIERQRAKAENNDL